MHGPSMLPTLNLTGDVVIAEHVSHRVGKLTRGDLILVRSPENPNRTVTKRIVGIEGDRVSFFVLDRHRAERHRTALVCVVFLAHSLLCRLDSISLSFCFFIRAGSEGTRVDSGRQCIRFERLAALRACTVRPHPGKSVLQGNNVFFISSATAMSFR